MQLIACNDRFSESPVTILSGATRSAILIGGYAFKFPCVVHGWRNFLRGLIANAMEREWWKSGCNDGLCPIPFSIPGGWLVVMPRCEPVAGMDDELFNTFVNRSDYVLPVENKDDSFGWLGGEGGRLVAIDYGG